MMKISKQTSFFSVNGVFILLFVMMFQNCKSKKASNQVAKAELEIQVPSFNADSAYAYIQKQVDFGYRIPNTKSHEVCGEYLVEKLKSYGAIVSQQKFQSETYDGQTLDLTNIIAKIFPEKKKRILLAAHWDTRPFADKDTVSPNKPFDGANDGASGVGVLLEIARILHDSQVSPEVGVDIIFFDGEDWGEPVGYDYSQNTMQKDYWCLGSQYWEKEAKKERYSAYYGILLDMVGAKDALFAKEEISYYFAPKIIKKVWTEAAILGYGNYFSNEKISSITDDHYYVNKAGIPMIDIIDYDSEKQNFGHYHHTHQDNMSVISKETLKAVGQTVLSVLYKEK